MPTPEEIVASKTVWDAYEKRAVLTPTVRLYLTRNECAKRYGTYETAAGPVPIVPGHVELTDFTCPHCGEPAPGFVEYGGVLACSRDCATLLAPEHEALAGRVEGATARFAKREEMAELAARLDEIKRELGVP